LQAGGHRFDSDILHQEEEVLGKSVPIRIGKVIGSTPIFSTERGLKGRK
jgi:hypothetical protein